MKKYISVLLTISMIITIFSNVFALPGDLTGISPQIPEGKNTISVVLGAFQWIGYAIALGMLIYVGIKYTMSAANEKADLKKGLINFVIGAVIIAGAATICGWITTFAEKEIAGSGTLH